MPQTKQGKKEIRKGAKKAAYNLEIKQNLKTLIKKTRQAIDAKDDKAKIEESLKKVQKGVDKAIQKGVIKKNTGRRRLSRLTAYAKKDGAKVIENQEVKKEKTEQEK